MNAYNLICFALYILFNFTMMKSCDKKIGENMWREQYKIEDINSRMSMALYPKASLNSSVKF